MGVVNGLVRFAGYVAGWGSVKARKWYDAQKGVIERWKQNVEQLPEKRILFHVSSVGEYEQIAPVISLLKKRFPNISVLVSYFSPSVERFKHKWNVDFADYLPFGNVEEIRRWIRNINPEFVGFVKYDHWPEHLKVFNQEGFPVYSVASLYSESDYFFKWYGILGRKLLSYYSYHLVQDEQSKSLLNLIGIKDVEVVGDPRVDRSLEIARTVWSNSLVERWFNKHRLPVIVAGSTYCPEEELIAQVSDQLPVRWIIAPHDLSPERIDEALALWGTEARLLSEMSEDFDGKAIIVDQPGILKYIYRYGKLAIIGGGFTKQIHNILEPISYGLPVLSGPRLGKFLEAHYLAKNGGLKVFTTEDELLYWLQLLLFVNAEIDRSRRAVYEYINTFRGASRRIVKFFVQRHFSSISVAKEILS